MLVHVLRRHLDCTLPIEIWHIGPREMPPLLAGIFGDLGCDIVDALGVLREHPAQVRDGWQLKAYALMNSSFEEVVLLDADQVPVVGPAVIFDWPEYREIGAILWPDLVSLSPENPVWGLAGLAPREIVSCESGQLCIDKRRHWAPVAVTLKINEMAEEFYQLVYGDKDTFLLGWLRCDAPFRMVPYPPLAGYRFLAQRDFAGNVVFQHRTNCKWRIGQPDPGQEGFAMQDECEAALAELGAVWNGRDFDPAPRSSAARDCEREVIALRDFRLNLSASPSVDLALLPGHQIGKGRSLRLTNWCVVDGTEGLRLVLYSAAAPSVVLDASSLAAFASRTEWAPVQEALLEPSAHGRRSPDPADAGQAGLVDEFIDVYLRGGAGSPSAAELIAALRFVGRMEAGVRDRVLARAAMLEPDRPDRAGELREIAGSLHGGTLELDAAPSKATEVLFNDPRRSLRP